MECLLPYLRMVTVPHIRVGLERMLDYRGVGLARFHCTKWYQQNIQNHQINETYSRGIQKTNNRSMYVHANTYVHHQSSNTLVIENRA